MNFDKSAKSFQISEELVNVLVVRELVNADGKIKDLHDLTLEDMSEIIDEIKSEELNHEELPIKDTLHSDLISITHDINNGARFKNKELLITFN